VTSTAALDYDLPDAAIAQVPIEPRDAARLLVDRGPDDPPEHRTVADLPSLVGPGDLIVRNDTRVIPARLHLHKATGGAVEVLLLERTGWHRWEALVRPGRRVPPGTVVEGSYLQVEVGEDLGDGRRAVELRVHRQVDELDAIDDHGDVPLPPYIHEPLADPSRYQTVYADEDSGRFRLVDADGDRLRSVAAPTAGLHLTPDVLERCRMAGARVADVRLAVGLGTFRPITADHVEDHHMHGERFSVPLEVLAECERADRVLAVGTTVVRALESAARAVEGGKEADGRTELFIHDDFDFRVVDRLLTNFHVPRSSLLALVDAFIGSRWRRLYETALVEGYRFLSFGDAMLLDHRWGRAA
jgi:S-adenosylmethionine:tRNA ribosyltransferase-isomerase